MESIESSVAEEEARAGAVKPDNQARILWADPARKAKTRFSVVYLHGFGGSQGDGMGVHLEFARRYGCNLYLSRLYGHGLESQDALAGLTPENYLESAKRAVSIAGKLGDSVIIMATSTGATLALLIASEHPEIAGLILYSPNIDFYDKAASILTKPWGIHIARLLLWGKYTVSDDPDSVKKYWYSKYRLEALASVQNLLTSTMTRETFSKIHQPLFVGYYYRDDANQDHRVSVSRMLQMFGQVGTPSALKREIAFPDAGVHPIASRLMAHDIDAVRRETYRFAEEVLDLVPVTEMSARE